MEEIKNTDAEYGKLKAELEETEKRLASGGESEGAGSIRATVEEIRAYLQKSGAVLLKVVKLSRGLLGVSGGRITCSVSVRPFDFTAATAAEVAAEQQRRISYCLKYMSENGVEARYLAEMAKSLNTLYAICDGAEGLAAEMAAFQAESRKKEEAALRAKREQIIKKLQALEKKRDAAYKRFVEENEASGLSNLSYPKAYPQSPRIALGVNSDLRKISFWILGNGLLYIRRNSSHSAADALKPAVMRFLSAFPNACAQILYCSSHMDDEVNSFLDMLNAAEVFYGDFNKDNSAFYRMSDTVDDIQQLYKLRTSLLNRNREDAVADYNIHTPKDVQSPLLVIFQDYPNGFENCNNLEYLFKNGAKYGVYFIITEGEAKQDYLSDHGLPDPGEYADVCIECTGDRVFSSGGITYAYEVPTRDEVDDFVKRITEAKKAGRTYVTYEDIGFGEERAEGAEVGAKLSFCVGKCQNKDYYLNFVTEGDGPTSFAVLGNSGAGKSSLIDSMIYSGCMKYSPDDLNFYLIDFKEGASSDEYLKNARMPHIKMVASHSRPEEADVILDNILSEQKRRLETFKNYDNCKSLARYNAIMDKSGKPHLPRLIIVIDETVEMLKDGGEGGRVDRIIDKCDRIVSQGRSSGVHIVLSFLRIETKVKRIVDLISGRCSFKTDKDNATGFLNKDASRLMPECTNGVALVSEDAADTFNKVKFAYVGKNGGSYYAKQVCERWSGYPIETVVIGDNTRYTFNDALKKGVFSDLSGATVGESYYTHNPVRLPFDDTCHSMAIVGNDQKVQTDYITSIMLYALSIGAEIKLVDGAKISRGVRERPLHNMFGGKCNAEVTLASGYLKMLAEAYSEQTRRIKDMDNEHHPYFFIVHCLQNTLFTTNDKYIPEDEEEEDGEEEETGAMDDFGFEDIRTMREGPAPKPKPKPAAKKSGVMPGLQISGADTFRDMLRKLGRADNFFVIFSVDSPDVVKSNDVSNVRYKILHREITANMSNFVNSNSSFKAYTDKDFCNEHLSLMFVGGALTEKIRHVSYDYDEATVKSFFKEVKKNEDKR